MLTRVSPESQDGDAHIPASLWPTRGSGDEPSLAFFTSFGSFPEHSRPFQTSAEHLLTFAHTHIHKRKEKKQRAAPPDLHSWGRLCFSRGLEVKGRGRDCSLQPEDRDLPFIPAQIKGFRARSLITHPKKEREWESFSSPSPSVQGWLKHR